MTDVNVPNFDLGFLQVSEAKGRANAFPTAPDGEYDMISVESVIEDSKSTQGGKNWKISFCFPQGTDMFDEFGKKRFTRWIALTQQGFPQIAEMYKALFGEPWPEKGLDAEEFLSVVQAATGKHVVVVLEEAPHYKADFNDPNNEYNEVKQNNIISVHNPDDDAEDFEATFSPEVFGDEPEPEAVDF